eukprot:g5343.t1
MLYQRKEAGNLHGDTAKQWVQAQNERAGAAPSGRRAYKVLDFARNTCFVVDNCCPAEAYMVQLKTFALLRRHPQGVEDAARVERQAAARLKTAATRKVDEDHDLASVIKAWAPFHPRAPPGDHDVVKCGEMANEGSDLASAMKAWVPFHPWAPPGDVDAATCAEWAALAETSTAGVIHPWMANARAKALTVVEAGAVTTVVNAWGGARVENDILSDDVLALMNAPL